MNLIHLLRDQLQLALASRGLRISRITPIDLRSDEMVDPRTLLLKASKSLTRSYLLDIPLIKCRSTIGACFDEREPYVLSMQNYPSFPATYEGSLLERFYRTCQPQNAAEALGLSELQAPGFIGLPASAFLMPWRDLDPVQYIKLRMSQMSEEALRYDRTLTIEDGLNHFGPVSTEKGQLELDRLRILLNSITTAGYRRHNGLNGDITGQLLTQNDGSWCINVADGQHRTAVAAVLRFDSVPIRINSAPIKREEVDYWPQVAAGRITREGALAVFDRVMRGNPPPTCRLAPLAEDYRQ